MLGRSSSFRGISWVGTLAALVLVGGSAFAQTEAGGATQPPGADQTVATGDPTPMDAGEFIRRYGTPSAAPAKAGEERPRLTPEEQAARGVVSILRAGQPLALGSVLAGDGRVLTALSPLGSGNDLLVKYADGSTAPVKVGHHDRAWDLALLVPQSGKWAEGLTASTKDPLRKEAAIRSFSSSQGTPTPVPMTLLGFRSLLGGDDQSLPNALEIGSRISPRELGSPIVDEDGRVVGVISRGCAPAPGNLPCVPVALGAPLHAIKYFLKTTPPDAVAPKAWLGIQGVKEITDVAKGVRVLVVRPHSPADRSGLRGGAPSEADLILAVGGVPVTSPESLAEAVSTRAVGEEVPLTVLSGGKYRELKVKLAAAPTARAIPSGAVHPAQLPVDAGSESPDPRIH